MFGTAEKTAARPEFFTVQLPPAGYNSPDLFAPHMSNPARSWTSFPLTLLSPQQSLAEPLPLIPTVLKRELL